MEPSHPVSDRFGAAPPQGGDGDRHRPGRRPQKKPIEDAYRLGELLGLTVWRRDEAGPFQTVAHPGGWRPEGDPARQPHEYLRNGTAKVLTLFHPADGRVASRGRPPAPTGCCIPG